MDDLDAKLALMEALQVRCPECSATGLRYLRPVWYPSPVRCNLDGSVSNGYDDDALGAPDVLPPTDSYFQCLGCTYVWPVGDTEVGFDPKVQYAYDQAAPSIKITADDDGDSVEIEVTDVTHHVPRSGELTRSGGLKNGVIG